MFMKKIKNSCLITCILESCLRTRDTRQSFLAPTNWTSIHFQHQLKPNPWKDWTRRHQWEAVYPNSFSMERTWPVKYLCKSLPHLDVWTHQHLRTLVISVNFIFRPVWLVVFFRAKPYQWRNLLFMFGMVSRRAFATLVPPDLTLFIPRLLPGGVTLI